MDSRNPVINYYETFERHCDEATKELSAKYFDLASAESFFQLNPRLTEHYKPKTCKVLPQSSEQVVFPFFGRVIKELCK